jgi:two-component sensor histidine kinase
MTDAGSLLADPRAAVAAPADAIFRAAFEATPNPMLLLAADAPRFTMLEVNPAHLRAFQTKREALVGRGVFEVFPADPGPVAAAFMEAIRASFDQALATGAPSVMAVQPFSVIGPDGRPEERYLGAVQTPLKGPGGEATHILSTVRDLTAEVNERRGAEARALLMREVDHRARNALTVVQSVVRLTEAADLAEFKDVVLGRVEVLGRAQTSLARRKWEGADLTEVVQAELSALAPEGRYEISGPPALLPAEQVQAMSMVLHELATNAVKYGAWSAAEGRVAVGWALRDDVLALTWRETGGPPVAVPARTGFGSRLIRQLAAQLGGEVRKDWRPEGLRVELTAAL